MQSKFGADTADGFDVDMAIHALDDPFNNVHAHATARLVTHLLGSREAGKKDELDSLGFWKIFCDVGTHEATLDRFRPDFVDIQTGSVVFHFDQNGIASMGGME